jgi:flavin reductase (DIM6/NTAB) family NADH-FMN oxidoreductase RutF
MGDFDVFFSGFDAPVIVVTAATDDLGRSGCLVGFATQCSIYPPRFLACLSVVNHTYGVAKSARSLGVHVLGRDQAELAALFGEATDDKVDKFAQVEWRLGASAAPLLLDCAAWLEGWIGAQLPLGDHVGFLLEPIAAGRGPRPGTLPRSSLSWRKAGHPAEEAR